MPVFPIFVRCVGDFAAGLSTRKCCVSDWGTHVSSVSWMNERYGSSIKRDKKSSVCRAKVNSSAWGSCGKDGMLTKFVDS